VGTVKDPRTSRPVSIADATVGGASSGAGVAIPEPPGAAPGGGAGALDDGPGIRGAVGPRRPSGHRLLDATGRPYGAPAPFNAAVPVPPGLVWVLVIGSDARPGEPPLRTRADSIHLLAANPATGQATVIGFPRDSFVDIEGHGTAKINTALVYGGPELLARTINRFTGLPVQYWVVAGFEAFPRVIDEVGGVDVKVPTPMDDQNSGAHFLPGYHHFDGQQALAFSRDRHDFADGDLARSRNQGLLVLAALAKLRAEVGDEAGLRRWLAVAFAHLSVDVNPEQALQLLAVARRTDPAQVTNLVMPGQGGTAGAQSVVYLDAREAAAIADDVRPDAAIGPALPTTTTATATPPTSTTSPPPPTSPAGIGP
ncbi:MAG: LCP family protein, partial [Acidimicrobiales bacterium]